MDKPKYKCKHCDKEYAEARLRNRHEESHLKPYTCIVCGKSFGRPETLRRHLKTQHTATYPYPSSPMQDGSVQDEHYIGKPGDNVHYPIADPTPSTSTDSTGSASGGQAGEKRKANETPYQKKKKKKVAVQYDCTICGATYNNMVQLYDHFKIHVDEFIINDRQPTMEQALNQSLKVVTFFSHGAFKGDLWIFFGQKKYDILRYLMDTDGMGTAGVRWFMCVGIKYKQVDQKDKNVIINNSVGFHNSKAAVKMRGEHEDSVLHKINEAFKHMSNSSSNYQKQESSWIFQAVEFLKLCMGKYRPLKGSSYIPLPKEIRFSRAILNIQNKDEKCFLWSILASLHPVPKNQHGYRVTKYLQFQHELSMKDISYPVPVVDIPKFEKQNNMSVNVIGYDEAYYPLYISKQQKQHHANLLLFEKEGNTHYCLIKDFDKMLYSQTNHHNRKNYCTYCLHGFTTPELLLKHQPNCARHGLQRTVLPTQKNKYMKFKNIAKMLKVPYVIYADFESLLIPTDEPGRKHEHQPCGYSYLIVSTLPNQHFQPVCYRGPNVLEHFFENILNDGDILADVLKDKKEINMTDEDETHYRQTATCHICKCPTPPDDKVQDHCHLTGKYRGPAHNLCNLAYQKATFIPVFFHNLEGYDSHLLMQHLGTYKNRKLSCISKNMEKYISFSLGPLRFLDSLSFMSESLASLVTNLGATGDSHFHHIKRHFPDPTQRQLLLRKGVYPYEWMDDESKFAHTSLPDRKAFYSSLALQDISEEDYQHAQNVWRSFDMKTMGDYHDLYLKSDVLLLADCFENFRNQCLQYYGLDPAHYYTAPGLSWDAALKMTGVELELLTDIDMHLMIEKGVRGGVSTISTRYAKANNSYMADYDKDKPPVYLLDLDANNLYGWAMSQPLPTHGFKWSSEEKIEELSTTIMDVAENDPTGYILEVDLEIPEDKHDYFNHYVPAPEHITVTEDMLSPYNKLCLEKLGMKHAPSSKLIPNLHNKEKYVVHYRTLQTYLQLGLKLTKIHRVVEFQQSAWLKEYIDFNTDKRANAKNAFEKNFFKLMNNSVFGKVSENFLSTFIRVGIKFNLSILSKFCRYLHTSPRPLWVDACMRVCVLSCRHFLFRVDISLNLSPLSPNFF